jgi:hypothetical protein
MLDERPYSDRDDAERQVDRHQRSCTDDQRRNTDSPTPSNE